MPPLYTGEIGTKLGSYLNSSLFIPRIQRGYVWSASKVAGYLECIHSKLMAPDAADATPTFWGYSIYVWEDEFAFTKHIVDGQQRSITMFLTFLALRDLFGDTRPQIRNNVNAMLLRHTQKGNNEACITSSYPDDNEMLKQLACGKGVAASAGAAATPAAAAAAAQVQTQTSTPSRRRRASATAGSSSAGGGGSSSGQLTSSQLILAAYEAARQKLQELLGEGDAAADQAWTLFTRLRSNFLVDVFKITDLADAAELFENINSKGVKITPFDLSCCIIMSRKEGEEGVSAEQLDAIFTKLHDIDKRISDIRTKYDAKQMAADKVLLLASEHLQHRIERHAYANSVKSITALLSLPAAVAATSATSATPVAAAAAAAAAAGAAAEGAEGAAAHGSLEGQQQQQQQQPASVIDQLLAEAEKMTSWIEQTFASPFGFAAMQFVPWDVMQFFILPLASKHGIKHPAFKRLLQTLAAASVRSGEKAVQEGSRHMSTAYTNMRDYVAQMWCMAITPDEYVNKIRQCLIDAHAGEMEDRAATGKLCQTRFSKAAVKGILLLEEAYEQELAAAAAASEAMIAGTDAAAAAAASAAAAAATAGRSLVEHGVAPYKLSGNTSHAAGAELLGNWLLLAPGFGVSGKRMPCYNPKDSWAVKKRKLDSNAGRVVGGEVLVTTRLTREMHSGSMAEVQRMTHRRVAFLELETAVTLFDRERPKPMPLGVPDKVGGGGGGGGGGDGDGVSSGEGEQGDEDAMMD